MRASVEHPFDVTIKGGHLVAFPDLELCALVTFELDVHDPLLLAMGIVHAIKGEVLEVILRRGSPEEQEDDCLHCWTAFTVAIDRLPLIPAAAIWPAVFSVSSKGWSVVSAAAAAQTYSCSGSSFFGLL